MQFLNVFIAYTAFEHTRGTRPHSASSTTITRVLGIRNTFETASYKCSSEEMLLFSYDTFSWCSLPLSSILGEDLNSLTWPKSTLPGLTRRLSGALTGTDWLIGGDGCYLVLCSSAGHLNNINGAEKAEGRSALQTMNDGLLANQRVSWQMHILWHSAVASVSGDDKCRHAVCVCGRADSRMSIVDG